MLRSDKRVWWIEPMPDVYLEGKEILEKEGIDVEIGRLQTEADKPYSEDEIIEKGKDFDAILLIAREKLTERIFANLQRLKIVVKAGVGVDNIDVEAATKYGVLVANTPVPEDYIGVAEGTVARLLAIAKKILICDKNVKENKWLSDYDKLRGTYVRGKTIGILGFGRIGSYVARLMKPWGVKVITYDPYASKEKALLLDVDIVDFDTLIRESDFLCIHAILTPETKHMINEDVLKKMKNTSYIINTARGPIIDEKALYKALKEKWIAGAALDVFENEPPTNSPILSPEISDKLILSPHVSGLSREMEKSLTLAQVNCCIKALKGEVPETTLNKDAIQKWREKFR
jgi:D-3-phosphoglycerate dehydrogenase